MQTHHWLLLAVVLLAGYVAGNMMLAGNLAGKVGLA